jgi:hypothetical protein
MITNEAKIESAVDAKAFVMAGDAVFTLASVATGRRYTYRMAQAEPQADKAAMWFVQLLTGPDNTDDYTYLGIVVGGEFKTTKKSKMTADSLPCLAIAWTIRRLAAGKGLDQVEVWHAGRCGRCGRRLTVPESVATGLGPDCAGKVGA